MIYAVKVLRRQIFLYKTMPENVFQETMRHGMQRKPLAIIGFYKDLHTAAQKTTNKACKKRTEC